MSAILLDDVITNEEHEILRNETMQKNSIFENIKHVDENGNEYWSARELSKVLRYSDYRNFELTIFKAMEACKNSGFNISDHFGEVTEMVQIGSGAQRKISSYRLSRYACYLAVQNGDPKKEEIALAQTYFAVQTRRQELQDEFNQLTEDQRRLSIRDELTEHNKSLGEAAQQSGVETPHDYAIFQNKGYQGLYGGLGQKEIHKRKKLKKTQKILDHMGSEELAANLFRATQTDAKLRREHIQGKESANKAHYEVGAKVRKTIAELGGTMPEDLPTPEKSIKSLRREEEKRLDKQKETDGKQISIKAAHSNEEIE